MITARLEDSSVAREQDQRRYDQDNDGDPVRIRRNHLRGHVALHRTISNKCYRSNREINTLAAE
jgi:hypothetical protein